MNRTPRFIKHGSTVQNILAMVKDNPGIGSKKLTSVLSKATSTSTANIDQLLRRMVNGKMVVRTVEHSAEVIKGENGKYRYWANVPAGYSPSDVQVVCPPQSEQSNKKRRAKVQVQELPKLTPEQRNAKLDPPTVYRNVPEFVAPKFKPGTFLIDLVVPDGSTIKLTVDEARRMYEQLYRLFGANGL